MRLRAIVGILSCAACGGDDASPATSGVESTTAAESTGDDPTGSAEVSEGSSEGGTTTTGPSSGSSGGETLATGGSESGKGSESEGDPGGGTIDVTLDGCAIDFGGTIVVSYNGSLGVASVYDDGATLTGSFQFELDGAGSMSLSSQHRVDTGNVVNMVDPAQGTWTNLDADALTSGVDRISGTLGVEVWNPSEGQATLTFDAVSLLNVSTDQVCTIDGTVEATELYP